MIDDVTVKLDKFFADFETKPYKKGEMIINAHDPIDHIFYLKKGYVRQYFISPEGEELTLHTYRPGSFFPISLVLTGGANKYFFESWSNVEAKKAPATKVVELIRNDHEILFDLTRRLSAGLTGYLSRTEKATLEGVQSRVISLLVYLAKHFGKEKDGKMIIDLPLTHKEMAAWIGISRETVSREVEKLVTKKLIKDKDRQITINNLKSLETEIN